MTETYECAICDLEYEAESSATSCACCPECLKAIEEARDEEART